LGVIKKQFHSKLVKKREEMAKKKVVKKSKVVKRAKKEKPLSSFEVRSLELLTALYGEIQAIKNGLSAADLQGGRKTGSELWI